jgi:hypothetical protein
MFCTHCGNKLIESNKFCTNCGTPVKLVNAASDPIEEKILAEREAQMKRDKAAFENHEEARKRMEKEALERKRIEETRIANEREAIVKAEEARKRMEKEAEEKKRLDEESQIKKEREEFIKTAEARKRKETEDEEVRRAQEILRKHEAEMRMKEREEQERKRKNKEEEEQKKAEEVQRAFEIEKAKKEKALKDQIKQEAGANERPAIADEEIASEQIKIRKFSPEAEEELRASGDLRRPKSRRGSSTKKLTSFIISLAGILLLIIISCYLWWALTSPSNIVKQAFVSWTEETNNAGVNDFLFKTLGLNNFYAPPKKIDFSGEYHSKLDNGAPTITLASEGMKLRGNYELNGKNFTLSGFVDDKGIFLMEESNDGISTGYLRGQIFTIGYLKGELYRFNNLQSIVLSSEKD